MKHTAWLSLLLLGCSIDPTQVLVHVDGEPMVRDMTNSLGIRIWGRAGGTSFVDDQVLTETAALREPYPWIVALRPFEDDSSRFFRVEASAYDGVNGTGRILAQARLASGYVDGQVLHVYLLLQDSCIGVECGDLDTTCLFGSCVPIPDAVPFDPDGGFPDGGSSDGGIDRCMSPSPEVCNGEDDDCDGATDEGIDLESDVMNCSECGNECEAPRGVPACVLGECEIASCDDGWGDCDDVVPGCETDLGGRDNCGSCGNACTGALLCDITRGCVSTCTPPLENCSGSCVDTDTSVANCGGCGTECEDKATTTESCLGGECNYACIAGRGDCDGSGDGADANGCEVALGSAIDNCGTCGTVCSPVTCNNVSCITGVCRMSANDSLTCSDGDPCTTDNCRGGSCQSTGSCGMDAGPPECMVAGDCADGDPCTTEVCMSGVCNYLPVPMCCRTTAECDDFDACTSDSCTGNMCINTVMPGCTTCFTGTECDDMMACTTDTCDAGVCQNTPVGGGCMECGPTVMDPCFGQCCSDTFDYCCGATDTCCNGFCCAPTETCCGSGCCLSGETCCAGSCCPSGACDAGICNPDGGVDGGSDAGTGFDSSIGVDGGA